MCKNCHDCFITLQVVTSGAILNLPDNQRLRQNKIKAISMRRVAGGTYLSKTGATLAADTVTATAHLSLKNANGTELLDMPLTQLQRDYNNPEPLCVDYEQVDPTASTIVLSTSASGYSATAVFEITFEISCNPVCDIK